MQWPDNNRTLLASEEERSDDIRSADDSLYAVDSDQLGLVSS